MTLNKIVDIARFACPAASEERGFGSLIVVVRDVHHDLVVEAANAQRNLFQTTGGQYPEFNTLRQRLQSAFASCEVVCLPPAHYDSRVMARDNFCFDDSTEDFQAAALALVQKIHAHFQHSRRFQGALLTGPMICGIADSVIPLLNNDLDFLFPDNLVSTVETRIVHQLRDGTIARFTDALRRFEGLNNPEGFNARLVAALEPILHDFQRRVHCYNLQIRDEAEQQVQRQFVDMIATKVRNNEEAVTAVVTREIDRVVQLFADQFLAFFRELWQRIPVTQHDNTASIDRKYNTDLTVYHAMLLGALSDLRIGRSWHVHANAGTLFNSRTRAIRTEVLEEFATWHAAAVEQARQAARTASQRALIDRQQLRMQQQREQWRAQVPAAEDTLLVIFQQLTRPDGLGAYFDGLRTQEVLDLLREERDQNPMSDAELLAELIDNVRACRGPHVPDPLMRGVSEEISWIQAQPEALQNRERLQELMAQAEQFHGVHLSNGVFLQKHAMVMNRLESASYATLVCPNPGWTGARGRQVWRLQGFTIGRALVLVWNCLRTHKYREDGVVNLIDHLHEAMTTNPNSTDGNWCPNGHVAEACASIHGFIELPGMPVEIFNSDIFQQRVFQNTHVSLQAALQNAAAYLHECGMVALVAEPWLDAVREWYGEEATATGVATGF